MSGSLGSLIKWQTNSDAVEVAGMASVRVPCDTLSLKSDFCRSVKVSMIAASFLFISTYQYGRLQWQDFSSGSNAKTMFLLF